MDIGENFLMQRAVRPLLRLLRDVVESPSLQEFKSHADVALGDMG